VCVILALAWVAGITSSSQAQTREDRGSRIIDFGEQIIEGQIEKPEAYYVLRNTNLNYEEAELQESFIPELLRTVEQAPF